MFECSDKNVCAEVTCRGGGGEGGECGEERERVGKWEYLNTCSH